MGDKSSTATPTADYQANPANWRDGDGYIVVPSIPTTEIPEKFPKGHKEITPIFERPHNRIDSNFPDLPIKGENRCKFNIVGMKLMDLSLR